MSFFLTGTDTGAGKTYVTALLLRVLRGQGVDAVGMKPICCGGREDAEALWEASGEALPLNQVNPVWLRTPAAPYTAALVENRPIDLDLVRETYAALRATYRCVLVEGVGGWMVPITDKYSVADLATEMNLPVVVVAANRLGVINHTLLTVQSIYQRGLTCAGVILNDVTPGSPEESVAITTNAGILETLLDVPILLQITHGQTDLQIPHVLRRWLSA